MKDWPTYFRDIAEVVKSKSKDKSTKIGAIIVGPRKEVVSTGYNSFPRGIDDEVPERHERPEKYYWFEHAERNAIYNAASTGVPTSGSTMYLSCGIPCMDCARGIVQAGIKEVWCLHPSVDPLMLRQRETGMADWDESFKRSKALFDEAGVIINYYPTE